MLVLAALVAGAATLPSQKRGAVEASLEVSVASESRRPGPGLGAVTYRVLLRGPAGLEAAPLRLEDAAEAWQVEAQTSAWAEQDAKAVEELTVRIKQIKTGNPPLPDVRVRFREGPGAAWDEVQWHEVLGRLRSVPAPGPPPEEPAVPAWLWLAAGGVLVAGLVGTAWLLRRRRTRPAEMSPAARALAELDRLEQTAMPPDAPQEGFYVQLTQIIRRYLAERFGLKALEQTTAELLAAARALPELSTHLELLRDFCDHCDLARFAGAVVRPEECLRALRAARTLVEQTAPGPTNKTAAPVPV